jgi:NADPH:quinone reductase-like Zn-dependent oxidoreductase
VKAIVYTEFGPPDVLQLKEVATPTPKDNEILVRVHASTVNYGDTLARNFRNIPADEFHMLARYWGAEVTGVCGTPRVEYVRSLGADKVIDYTREDFTQNGENYDLIVDILGKSSFAQCEGSLTEHGIYLLASFKMKPVFEMVGTSLPGRQAGKRVICAMASEKPEALDFIRELVEAGKYKVIVDRCYPLEQTAEAHRYVESGLKKGPVAITVDHNRAI